MQHCFAALMGTLSDSLLGSLMVSLLVSLTGSFCMELDDLHIFLAHS